VSENAVPSPFRSCFVMFDKFEHNHFAMLLEVV